MTHQGDFLHQLRITGLVLEVSYLLNIYQYHGKELTADPYMSNSNSKFQEVGALFLKVCTIYSQVKNAWILSVCVCGGAGEKGSGGVSVFVQLFSSYNLLFTVNHTVPKDPATVLFFLL